MPECGLFDPQYRGMDSAQVFNALPDNDSPDDNGRGSGTGDGMDTHDWDGAQELSDAEQRELARDIDEAIRQGALIAGKMGSGGDRDLQDLLQPQIDWREALRDFIQTTCAGNDYSTWARPNRRYRTAGVYLPSGISEQVGELVLAIDTSASVGQRELTAFLTEVQAICDTVHPECVRVLYWDTKVCGDEKYDTHELDNLAKTTKPRGGGGTIVECVPKYIADNNITPQAVIVLTDGYVGSWGNWHHPVLWTILDNPSAKPDVGSHVNIKSGDM
jgi:predicted metal-dependent peptidase